MTRLVANVSSVKTQLQSALSLKCGDSSHNFWQHIQIPKLEKGHMTSPNALTLLLSPKNSPNRGKHGHGHFKGWSQRQKGKGTCDLGTDNLFGSYIWQREL